MTFRLMRYLPFILLFVMSLPAYALPDYTATIPCPGPKPDSNAVLSPNEPIIKPTGAAIEFAIQAGAGVNLTVTNWKINDQEIFDANGMTQAGAYWGNFIPSNGMKTLLWTLSGIKDGDFQLKAVVKRSCGTGVGSVGGNEKLEDMDLWGGTVVSLESVTWEMIDSPMSANPNLGGGTRMFPDQPSPGENADFKKIRVKVKIKPVKQDVTVYFKSFDVDDPSSESAPIDGNDQRVLGQLMTKGGDNRGTPQVGSLNGASAETDQNGFATVEFTTTMQPGDNFRVAAGLRQTDLLPLNNDNVLANDAPETGVFGSYAKLTPMLTVWRRLHVERDSMEAPADNYIEGNITQVNSQLGGGQRAVVDVDFTQGDPSFVLNSLPNGKGRFENGKLFSTGLTTEDLLGNGDTYVATKAGENFQLFGTIQRDDDDLPTSTDIVELTPGTPTIIKLTPDNPFQINEYQNGKFKIGDQTYTIVSNTANEIRIDATVQIPFRIEDDDSKTLLPHTPDVGATTSAIFSEAYIQLEIDGGGNLTNNENTVPFAANVGQLDTGNLFALPGVFDSKNNRSNNFWVSYILSGFQNGPGLDTFYSESKSDGDGDPDSEKAGPNGYTLAVTGTIHNATLLYMENIRETNTFTSEQRILAHELGHAFGLGHTGGVMTNTFTPGAKFTDTQLHTIRSRVPSP
jgi:hypothetical protein